MFTIRKSSVDEERLWEELAETGDEEHGNWYLDGRWINTRGNHYSFTNPEGMIHLYSDSRSVITLSDVADHFKISKKGADYVLKSDDVGITIHLLRKR